MYELDAYLDELVSLLDCDPLRRDEIRLEVHSHLRELLQEQTRKGKPPAEAARAAIARLGAAEDAAAGFVSAGCRPPWALGRLTAGRWATAIASVLAMPVLAVGGLWALLGWLPVQRSPGYYYAFPLFVALCVAAAVLCVLVVALVVWAVGRRPGDALIVGALASSLQLPALVAVALPSRPGCAVATFVAVVLAALYLGRPKTRPGRSVERRLPAPVEPQPVYEFDGYLDELVSRLECDPLRRDEIRLEVHSHLRELQLAEARAGRSPSEAVRAAVARFGAAEEVAPRLASANRGRTPTPWRPPLSWRGLGVVCAFLAVWVVLIPGTTIYVSHLMAYNSVAGRRYDAALWMALVAMALPGGPAAALVAWAISRRPWDALLASAVFVATYPFALGHGFSWTSWPDLVKLWGVAVTAAVTAYLLSRREKGLAVPGQVDAAEISRAT